MLEGQTRCRGSVAGVAGGEIVVCPYLSDDNCLASQIKPVQSPNTVSYGPKESIHTLAPTAGTILEACQNFHRR